MQRYKFLLEYDGSKFFGWQRQQIEPTVQQALEDQLAFLCKHKVTIWGAGRTDTGVHATGQVAHADLNYPHPPFRLQSSLNYFLAPRGLCVLSCAIVDQDFHARHSATYRAYEYKILNRYAPTVLNTKVWHVRSKLNVEAMHNAAQLLLGNIDFSSFRDSQCQSKTPIKSLSQFDIFQEGEYVVTKIKAKSFLHHQVRIMMGTIKNVGTGIISLDEFIQIRDAKDRTKAGPTAPPHGLTLTEVGYIALHHL